MVLKCCWKGRRGEGGGREGSKNVEMKIAKGERGEEN